MKKKSRTETMDIATLDNIAKEAGMSVHEFTELALYWMIGMCETDKEFRAGGGREFLRSSRKKRGPFPPVYIGLDSAVGSMLEDLAKATGLEKEELPMFCVQWLLQVAQSEPQLAKESAQAWKESIGKGNANPGATPHPFMERLFSGDLRAVHGPTFGDLASEHVKSEHRVLRDLLKRAFKQDWEEACCELMDAESIIRHCPALQNETAAIRTLLEAEKVLDDFCRSVDAN